VFGLGVSLEGIPILGEITDGNASDKTINGNWIRDVKMWLGKKKEDFLLYVADSAAVTSTNLKLFKEENIDFISRLPHTFGLADTLLDHAIQEKEGAWTEIGAISVEKGAATYRSISYHEELEGEDHRFVVCHSSSKDKRKLKSLNRAVEKEKKEISKETGKFSEQEFFCERDAIEQTEKFVKTMRKATEFHVMSYVVEKVERDKKRSKRGRPPKDYVPEKETRYTVKLTIERDEGAFELAEKKCGMFVLVSSLDEEKEDDGTVLQQYKGQGAVERLFRLFKSPTLVASYNLQSPTRIVAFGFVVLLAVLVYILTEYAVRKALEDKEVEPILDLRGKETRRPTAKTIGEILSSILVVRRSGPDGDRLEPDIPLNENQRRVLELQGFDSSIYTTAA
jgi:transposase